MVRIALPLSLVAASLAGCSSYGPGPAPSTLSAAPQIVMQEMPYRAGTGTVQSVREVSADTYRLGIRMSNGTLQWVDTESREIVVGSRIELTPDREIKKL